MWDTLWQDEEFLTAFNSYNSRINNSLEILKEKPYDAIGRDEDLFDLNVYMERPETPVVALLGKAGVGKSALIEEYAKQINHNKLVNKTGHKFLILSLRAGVLGAIGTNKLQTELANIFNEVEKLEKLAKKRLQDNKVHFIVFIDEFHLMVTIFGAMTKIGGDIAKDRLARPPIRVVTATTDREYNEYIATDDAFKERFQEMNIRELPRRVVLEILRQYYLQKAPELDVPDNSLLELIYEVGRAYLTENAEPRKSKSMVETMIGYTRATGNRPTRAVVEYFYRKQKGIELNIRIDRMKVRETIDKRVKGQKMAVWTAKRMVNQLAFPLDNTSNKPMATAMFTGPTGVGKTELAKSIAEGVFGDEKAMFTMNMPEYSLKESEPLFRKRLGEHLRRYPHTLILFDELEKAHQVILDNLLYILDEGLVRFDYQTVDGKIGTTTVSLRNTIIIGTTNAGHEVYNKEAKYRNNEVDMKVATRQLLGSLRNNLISGETKFRPEFLGRFQRIIPFTALDQRTLVEIGEVKLSSMLMKLKQKYQIDVRTRKPKDFAHGNEGIVFNTTDVNYYISAKRVNEIEAQQGGARNLDREFNAEIYDEILEKMVEYDGVYTFNMYMSEDSAVYKNVDVDNGGVIIEPA